LLSCSIRFFPGIGYILFEGKLKKGPFNTHPDHYKTEKPPQSGFISILRHGLFYTGKHTDKDEIAKHGEFCGVEFSGGRLNFLQQLPNLF
jgi:hypothetical protein